VGMGIEEVILFALLCFALACSVPALRELGTGRCCKVDREMRDAIASGRIARVVVGSYQGTPAASSRRQ
jgi:hypothetical protein